MKVLHLIRHAKSDWSDPNVPDIRRPINRKGRRNCQLMTQRIINAGCNFEYIYSSTAARAQLTIKWIAKTLPDRQLDWILDEDLYTFDGDQILKWCRKLPDKQSEVVIVGHNPALIDFCNKMLSQDKIDSMPTSSYVQLGFDIDSWKELISAKASLESFLKPKMFKD